MSETPTPSKGQTKRRGLALPPRGQALARLQDLERETEPDAVATENPDTEQPVPEVNDAVNTASSNAVSHQGSNAVSHQGSKLSLGDYAQEQSTAPPILAAAATPRHEPPAQSLPAQSLPAAAAPGARQHPAVRAAREPTTRITVDMPDSLHRKISLLSVETRRSIKDLVIEALAATYFGTDGNGE